MRSLETKYGLQEIMYRGMVFDFGKGGKYYHDSIGLPLPQGIGTKGTQVRTHWFDIKD